MWYFTWVLGIGFAVFLAILNALWAEHEASRQSAPRGRQGDNPPS
ncbi:cytochrome bd-I oxidase subunit CydX [Zoogloea sp.]|jgi:cyd operon protein YbgT|nr:cytochrome bd-I oxidase subunit CydX [Zoogloea sp.]HPI59740.1 cytochrome bd-I oxidase subunit CydX [Zoogloea sp.]